MAPLVSIVVPCYATAQRQLTLLDETLTTVAAQTHRNFEVLVVDDGSPVDVAAAVGKHPATRVIRQANTGCAAARNTGIAAARGDFFVFLDSDDYLLPAALERGLAQFDHHPETGFTVGQREEMTYEGNPVPWGIPAMPESTDLYKTLLGFDWYII
ncbi:MAG TPA: glycosyltransferase family A protein, partial [Planctomycetaceae bacterium]|nr:glycosyltransferase family A protein [Planctomycetaceae bacterium]